MEYVRSMTVAGPRDQVAALYVDTSLSDLPGTWNAVYEAPGIHNICDTQFVEVDAHTTRIEQRNVFRLTGMMRLVGLLFRGAFPQETEKSLRIYKTFVEKRLSPNS